MSEPGRPADGMSFLEHLQELRVRLMWSVAALFAGFFVCFPFSRGIFSFLSRPITTLLPPGETLAFTRLSEPFFLYLKVSALAGIFVASPVVLLQVWLFVSPALYRNEKRFAVPFIAAATFFFCAGAAFAFEFLFPTICRFFLEQGRPYRMVVTLDTYFSMLFWTVLGVALTFELPVVIGLLARLGVVSAAFLARHWQVAMVGCLVVAAVVTPTPDAMTMIFVAVPMMALYVISIGVARLLEGRRDAETGTGPTR